METKNPNISFIDKALQAAKKYSLWQILKAALIILLLAQAISLSVWVWTSGRVVADRYADITLSELDQRSKDAAATHDRAMAYRRNVAVEVKQLMKQTLEALGASRCYIIELHNGTNNPHGLPFMYGEVTYEVTDGVAEYMAEDYNQITLSRYDFPAIVRDRKVWMGSVENFEDVDPKMARRISAHDVKYFAMVHVSGTHGDLGYFGVDYCHETTINEEQLSRRLQDSAQRLASLLDFKE